jgi:hypothetical protein
MMSLNLFDKVSIHGLLTFSVYWGNGVSTTIMMLQRTVGTKTSNIRIEVGYGVCSKFPNLIKEHNVDIILKPSGCQSYGHYNPMGEMNYECIYNVGIYD